MDFSYLSANHPCDPPLLLVEVKLRSHLAEFFSPIVHDRDKSSNRERCETNRNDENTIMCDYLSEYYECFSDYMKIHHNRFWPFYGDIVNEARYNWGLKRQNESSSREIRKKV